MTTYVVVDTTAVEGLHATLGRTRVIVLDKSVVEALEMSKLAIDRTTVPDEAEGSDSGSSSRT